MKLNQHQKLYQYYFKQNKIQHAFYPHFESKYVKHFNTKSAKAFFSYSKPKISKLHHKIIKAYGIKNTYIRKPVHVPNNISIKPQHHVHVRMPIEIHGTEAVLIFTDHPMIILGSSFNPDMSHVNSTTNPAELILMRHNITDNSRNIIPEYSRENVNYYSEDEAQIFQYNTAINYDTARAMIHLNDKLSYLKFNNINITTTYIYAAISSTQGIKIL